MYPINPNRIRELVASWMYDLQNHECDPRHRVYLEWRIMCAELSFDVRQPPRRFYHHTDSSGRNRGFSVNFRDGAVRQRTPYGDGRTIDCYPSGTDDASIIGALRPWCQERVENGGDVITRITYGDAVRKGWLYPLASGLSSIRQVYRDRHTVDAGHWGSLDTTQVNRRNARPYQSDCEILNVRIKELIESYRRPNSTYKNRRDCWEELRDRLNDGVPARTIMRILEAVDEHPDLAGDPQLKLCGCGHVENRADYTTDGNGHTYCQSCAEDLVECEDDGELYPSEDLYWWDSDDAYHRRPEPEEDDEEDDEDSDDDEPRSDDPDGVLNYSTDVMRFLTMDNTFESTSHGDFHLGLELEVSTGEDYMRERHNIVRRLRRELGQGYLVCKVDGSITSDGIEMVMAPCRMSVHIEKLKAWEVPSDFRAWDTGVCGLHVHISSRAFTALALGKFMSFINADQNAALIRKIAGRHPGQDTQARRYCAQQDQKELATPAKALKASGNRYRMVNIERLSSREARRLRTSSRYGDSDAASTVELRIFRASLKKERLLAQIEFTHAAVMFCRVASWSDLGPKAFLKWLKDAAALYPNLARWYGVTPKTETQPVHDTCADQPEVATVEPKTAEQIAAEAAQVAAENARRQAEMAAQAQAAQDRADREAQMAQMARANTSMATYATTRIIEWPFSGGDRSLTGRDPYQPPADAGSPTIRICRNARCETEMLMDPQQYDRYAQYMLHSGLRGSSYSSVSVWPHLTIVRFTSQQDAEDVAQLLGIRNDLPPPVELTYAEAVRIVQGANRNVEYITTLNDVV